LEILTFFAGTFGRITEPGAQNLKPGPWNTLKDVTSYTLTVKRVTRCGLK